MELSAENLPDFVDRAKQAIDLASTFEEIKSIIDQSEMLRQYAKRIGAGLEAQNRCAEIKIRAERRMGQELEKLELESGRPGNGPTAGPLKPKLSDIGINKNQSARWQQIASLDDAEFDLAVQNQEEVTTRGVLRVAEQKRRQDRDATLADFAPPTGQYSIIVADPPWRYEHPALGTTTTRAVERQYPTMTFDEICALPVPAGPDALLYLWATAPKLAECLQVMEAWGFEYRTCAVWIKDKIGLGYHFRNKHELLLVGRRGNMPPPEPGTQLDSVVAERTEHSRKPDVFYDMVAACYPNLPRLEMFARGPRDGWDVWGNEA